MCVVYDRRGNNVGGEECSTIPRDKLKWGTKFRKYGSGEQLGVHAKKVAETIVGGGNTFSRTGVRNQQGSGVMRVREKTRALKSRGGVGKKKASRRGNTRGKKHRPGMRKKRGAIETEHIGEIRISPYCEKNDPKTAKN